MRTLALCLLLVTPALAEVTDVRIVGKELWVSNKSGGTSLYISASPSYDVSGNSVRYWREIYGVRGDSIVFLRTVEAKVTPARTVTTPEKIEWPAEEKK